MNHLKARQRAADGRYDYTARNGKHIHALGYCAGWRDHDHDEVASRMGDVLAESLRQTQVRMAPLKDRFHTSGHATEEEACECYRQYLLDTQLTFRGDEEGAPSLHPCAVASCTEYTSGSARVVGSLLNWHLCSQHRNRESVADFLSVGESWEG